MIQLNIISQSLEQAKDITSLLHKKQLVVNEFMIKEVIGRHPNDQGELTNIEEVLIVGTTKALLFNDIDQLLQEHFPEDMPILYATPIVYMNSDQSDDLRNNTAKV